MVGLRPTLMEQPMVVLALWGCGGMFRDHRGFNVRSFAIYIGIHSSLEAEIMGAIFAIELASANGWSRL